jgi:Flp pilus assembly protein TadD
LFTQRLAEAVTLLRRSIALQPNVGSTYHNLGLTLENVGDDEAAILAYRHAVALSPDNPIGHSRLADLLWRKGKVGEAAAEFERAAACEPDTTRGRLCKAMALVARDCHHEAEQELRRVLAWDGSDSRAHLLLGRVLQQAGRYGEAEVSFERSIALNPAEAGAYQGLANSRRLTEADRPTVARILLQLEVKDTDRSVAPAVRRDSLMKLHFAAGKGFDDLGDYAKAISHFHSANRIRRQICPFDGKGINQHVERLIARYTHEFFAHNSAIGHDDATPILIGFFRLLRGSEWRRVAWRDARYGAVPTRPGPGESLECFEGRAVG